MKSTTTCPIPVDVARKIARCFRKDLIVVLGYDRSVNRLHTTTYGRLPEEKQLAALCGEVCARALGVNLAETEIYEDFRTRPAAEAAATIERLRGLLGVAMTALECGSPSSRNGAFDPDCWLDLILQIRNELQPPKPSGVQDGDTTRPAMLEPAGNAAPREE